MAQPRCWALAEIVLSQLVGRVMTAARSSGAPEAKRPLDLTPPIRLMKESCCGVVFRHANVAQVGTPASVCGGGEGGGGQGRAPDSYSAGPV